MSTFTDHQDNIKALTEMGFDVSEAYRNGEVTLESWQYDKLVFLMQDMIHEMKQQGFKAKGGT